MLPPGESVRTPTILARFPYIARRTCGIRSVACTVTDSGWTRFDPEMNGQAPRTLFLILLLLSNFRKLPKDLSVYTQLIVTKFHIDILCAGMPFNVPTPSYSHYFIFISGKFYFAISVPLRPTPIPIHPLIASPVPILFSKDKVFQCKYTVWLCESKNLPLIFFLPFFSKTIGNF